MNSFSSELKWLSKFTKLFSYPILLLATLGAVLSIFEVSIAVVSKILIDSAVNGNTQKVIVSIVLFAIIILIQIGIHALKTVQSAKIAGRMINKLQKTIFVCLTKSTWSTYTSYHSGDLLTRLISDAKLVTDCLVTVLPDIISLGIELVAAFFILLNYDHTLAILAFALGPLTVIFNRIFGKKLKEFHQKAQETESKFRESLQENIQNMLVVKTFCGEESATKHITSLQKNRVWWMIQKSKLSVLARSVLSMGYWAGYFLAFCWGAFGIYQGTITFGTMTAFLQLVGQIQGPFIRLSHTYPKIVNTLASTKRIIEIQSLPSENRKESIPQILEAGIQFDKVTFSYHPNEPILVNVTQKILPGEIIALTGSSGEGKTTFIQLILALLYPVNGTIHITSNKREKWKATSSTRPLISYVPQGNTLFSGTIAENILAGNPDARKEELELALKRSYAWEFIQQLPNNMNTPIGEHGFGLSEGQAQRIAIARALVRECPILILDEATSALDVNTEKKVLQTIHNLKPSRTCIIITHRNTVFPLCDHILRIDGNRLHESK